MYKKIIKWTILVWMFLSIILLAIGYGFGWETIEIKKPHDNNVTVSNMQASIKADVDKFVHNYNDIFKPELEGVDSAKVASMSVVLNNKVTAEVNALVDQILEGELEEDAAKAVILDTVKMVRMQQETFAETIGSNVEELLAAEAAAAEKAKAPAKGKKKAKAEESVIKLSEKVENNTIIVKSLNNSVHKNLEEQRYGESTKIDLVAILLYWAYVMLVVGVCAMVIVSFVVGTVNDPKTVIRLLVVLALAAAVIALAYFTASGDPAVGIAAGKQPEAGVLKVTDTIFNLTMIMAVATVASMLFGWIYNMIKK